MMRHYYYNKREAVVAIGAVFVTLANVFVILACITSSHRYLYPILSIVFVILYFAMDHWYNAIRRSEERKP